MMAYLSSLVPVVVVNDVSGVWTCLTLSSVKWNVPKMTIHSNSIFLC